MEVVQAGEELCAALIKMGEHLPQWPKKLIFDLLIIIDRGTGMPIINPINIAKALPGLK
jgi:hypothetical protein